MDESIRKLVRTVQVRFPGLNDFKSRIVRSFRNLSGRLADPDFAAFRLLPQSDGARFLDVGANRGQSIDALLRTTCTGRIEAFEANPVLAERLKWMYRRNSRVTVHAAGLGDCSEEVPLFVPYYRRWMFDGLASTQPEVARAGVQDRVFFFRERDVSLQEVPCVLRRLDDLDLRPTLIKLDVEGSELAALRGGERTLAAYEPLLLIESPSPPLMEYLDGFGYAPFAFRDQRFFAGVLGKPNTFFLPPRWRLLLARHIS